jgi:hypothetical protein
MTWSPCRTVHGAGCVAVTRSSRAEVVAWVVAAEDEVVVVVVVVLLLLLLLAVLLLLLLLVRPRWWTIASGASALVPETRTTVHR